MMKKPICACLNNRGVSLIEVILAATIAITAVLSVALLAPKIVQSIAQRGQRATANSIGTSAVQQATMAPYATLQVTPLSSYPASAVAAGSFSCGSVDWTKIPSKTVTTAAGIFTQQLCTTYVSPPAGAMAVSPIAGDTGLKKVVARITWASGANTQTFITQNVVSRNELSGTTQLGTFQIIYCAAATGATGCPNPPPAWNGPPVQVSVYQGLVLGNNIDNNGNLITADPVSIPVPPMSGYSVHVQAAGFAPFHQNGLSVLPGAVVPIYAPLVQNPSMMAGEVFISSHPVISKVIDAYAQPTGGCTATASNATNSCNNASEALEIFNPTSSTFSVGGVSAAAPGGEISVQYCNVSTCQGPYDFSSAPFTVNNPVTGKIKILYPGMHLLIVGVDPNAGMPVAWGGVVPDVQYSVNDPSLPANMEGLIP